MITADWLQLNVSFHMHFMSHCSLFALGFSSSDALSPPQGVVSTLVYIRVFLIFAKGASDSSLAWI